MDIIRIKNMQFYGFHGVNESEKHFGGRFEVDVDLHISLEAACNSDELNDTINYELIYKTINSCMIKNKFNLIEALANLIAKEIVNAHPVEKIKVRVRKPNAPVNGVFDTIEVEIDRSRIDYA